jgi:hypothetical protein
MTAGDDRSYRIGILRDAQTVFSAAFLSFGCSDTRDLQLSHRIVQGSDGTRRGAVAVAVARFGADFAHFVEQCTVAADVTGTQLEPGFAAELLTIFCRQAERDLDHYERTGEFR